MPTPICPAHHTWSESRHQCVADLGYEAPPDSPPVCPLGWGLDLATGECKPPTCDPSEHWDDDTQACVPNVVILPKK